MPIIDLKRAYFDHLKTLSPEQRRAFGLRIRQTIEAHANDIIGLVLYPNKPVPYPIVTSAMREDMGEDAQDSVRFSVKDMLGERTDILLGIADSMANGAFDDVPEDEMDERLEEEFADLFDGIMEDEACDDNFLFDEYLRQVKVPAGTDPEDISPTPAQYRVNQRDKDLDPYFERYPEMEDVLGPKKKLTAQEIADYRETTADHRAEYEQKIYDMLSQLYENVAVREDFEKVRQPLVDADAVKKLGKGHGGEMYNYLADKSSRALNELAGRGPEAIARRKVVNVFKANTVDARLNEIRQKETEVMREKIFEAQRSGDPEKISAAVDDYRKLLAEVIALNGAAASKGADSVLNWKSINKAVGRRNDNGDFVRMTQNLTADTVLSELDVLKEQPLNQFLTHQAERLNAAHQAAQQPQVQPEVQQQPNRNEEFEEPEMLLN